MVIDFLKIGSIHKADDGIKNPVEIFYKSSHPEIIDLFPIQKEILDKWYENFEKGEKNNLIQLDTGAGKTLIGLYCAESLRKSKKGKVLYLCPDNFLIEQTIEKAKKYGIKVSSYYSKTFVNEEIFLSNDSICITNYHAIFNSNRFKEMNIVGVIFDDSHTAIDILDNKYSVTIDENENKIFYNNFINLFGKYDEISKDIEVIKERDNTINTLIPPIIWLNNKDIIKNYIDINIEKLGENIGYNWKYIRSNIDKCLCFIGVGKIEISLMYPIINDNYILEKDIDKVFLSATVNNQDDFIRFFGLNPTTINLPSMYRPDRLFLFTSIIKNKITCIEDDIIKNYDSYSNKTLILVPSKKDFEKIDKKINSIFLDDSNNAKDTIEDFKQSSNSSLIIANRYDGIDIDGDSGHFMIIMNMLNHSSLKNKFFGERIGNEKNEFLRSSFAGKITQAFGRTTRSSSDYSTIIIMGDKLNSILLNADNEKLFSKDLVEDLKIGKLLSDSIDSHQSFLDLIDANLKQDQGYKEYVQGQRTNIKGKELLTEYELNDKIKIAEFERKINNYYLNNNYNKCIENILNREFEKLLENYKLTKLYGIYLLIASYCYIQIQDIKKAQDCYDRGIGINGFLGKKNYKFELNNSINLFQNNNILKLKFKNNLIFNSEISSSIFEENIKQLGLLCGFRSIRPEKEIEGITLDNLWEDQERKIVVGLECKNEVKNSTLNKEDIGQSLDHYEWLKNEYKGYSIFYYIVGEINSITINSNPNKDFLLLGFYELINIYENIKIIYKNKELFPNDLDNNLINYSLKGLENIFSKNNKIIDLPLTKTN